MSIQVSHDWQEGQWDWPLQHNDGVVKVLFEYTALPFQVHNTPEKFEVGLDASYFTPNEIQVSAEYGICAGRSLPRIVRKHHGGKGRESARHLSDSRLQRKTGRKRRSTKKRLPYLSHLQVKVVGNLLEINLEHQVPLPFPWIPFLDPNKVFQVRNDAHGTVSRSISRSYHLPADVDTSSVKSHLSTRGVLVITAAKKH